MFGGVAVGPTHGIMVVVALVKEPCQFQPLADKADLGLNMVQTIIITGDCGGNSGLCRTRFVPHPERQKRMSGWLQQLSGPGRGELLQQQSILPPTSIWINSIHAYSCTKGFRDAIFPCVARYPLD